MVKTFDKYLFNKFSMPRVMLAAGNRAVTKTNTVSALRELN